MPRGKKELAEQITPGLREVEVEVWRGQTNPRHAQPGRERLLLAAPPSMPPDMLQGHFPSILCIYSSCFSEPFCDGTPESQRPRRTLARSLQCAIPGRSRGGGAGQVRT